MPVSQSGVVILRNSELGPDYQRLKELDQQLDVDQKAVVGAKDKHQQTLKEFATLCHQLWQQEKSQGSRQGKGFRQSLRDHGIKLGRAYRAMKKFFPADFPAQPKKVSTSFAANEVAIVRFAGNLPPRENGSEAKELLQCRFALTAAERAEFEECLKVIGAPQVQRLLLDAVKQAASAKRAEQAQEENQETRDPKVNGCKVGDSSAQNMANATPASRPPMNPQNTAQNNDMTPEEALWREMLDRRCEVTDRMNALIMSLNLHGDHRDLGFFFGELQGCHPQESLDRLDWIDAHPQWCDRVQNGFVADFTEAFKQVPRS